MSSEHRPPPPGGFRPGPGEDRFVGGRDLTTWRTRPGQALARWAQQLGRWSGPRAAVLVPLLLGLGLAVSMTMASAEVYDSVQETDGVAALDRPLLHLALSLRSPALDAAVTAFTHLGGGVGLTLLTLTATAVLAYRRRSWTPVVLVTVAAAGSLLMTVAGKALAGRARPALEYAVPPYEHSPAFPSGHSLNSLVLAGVVAYLLLLRRRSRWGQALVVVVAAGFALAMGLSRVYLGHHWFTDVLVAQTLGTAWLAVVITAHRLHLTARRRTAARPRSPAPDTGS